MELFSLPFISFCLFIHSVLFVSQTLSSQKNSKNIIPLSGISETVNELNSSTTNQSNETGSLNETWNIDVNSSFTFENDSLDVSNSTYEYDNFTTDYANNVSTSLNITFENVSEASPTPLIPSLGDEGDLIAQADMYFEDFCHCDLEVRNFVRESI